MPVMSQEPEIPCTYCTRGKVHKTCPHCGGKGCEKCSWRGAWEEDCPKCNGTGDGPESRPSDDPLIHG
jgi:DnaJ-class molecular chaperone